MSIRGRPSVVYLAAFSTVTRNGVHFLSHNSAYLFPKQNISVSSRLRGRSKPPEQTTSREQGTTHKQGCAWRDSTVFYRCLPKHQKAATRVTVFFQRHLMCQFLCLNSALSCKQLDFSKTSAQASRKAPNQGWFQTQPDDWQWYVCTRSRNRPQPVDARNLEQACQIEGQFHHRMSTCAVPALPLCTNRQSIQLAANLPTSHRVRKTTGAIHNTGATSTPGGYVREKPKTIQQQVKSERSARGYSTVKYGQINSSQTVSSPFTKPTNTITVSQLSSPTTTTLKTQYSSVLLQKKLFIIAGFFKLPRAHPWLAAVSSSC